MKRLVVIGGGFAGATVAKKLQGEFDVSLIDTKDYFEFTPGVLRTLVAPSHAKKLRSMHVNYLPNAKFIRGHVVDITKDHVVLKNKQKVPFDYLVIAAGSRYAEPIKEQDIKYATRSKDLLKTCKQLVHFKNILIVGGGLVGVELAAEICTFMPDKHVTLMHSRGQLIPRNSPKSIAKVERFLKNHGVKLVLNERLKDVKKNVVHCESGKKLKCDLLFLTIGTTPNIEFLEKHFKNSLSDRKLVKVDEFLRVKDNNMSCKNIFAAGDLIDLKEEKTGYSAEKHAETIVHNLRASLEGTPLEKYTPTKRPMIISLGKWNGVFESKNLVFGGFIAALMKSFVEWDVMRKFR